MRRSLEEVEGPLLDLGAIETTLLPRWPLSTSAAALREGVAVERNAGKSAVSFAYTFSPANTSTVVRSSLFQVASTIHVRVFPRWGALSTTS
jgi:hypothetical protein